MRSGQLFQRPSAERRIDESDCGYLPTLCARDYRNDILPNGSHSPGLARVIGGLLNPEWCEWFMGFPIGFTGLEPLEMHKFHGWLRKHGRG